MDTSELARWLYDHYDFSAVPDVSLLRSYNNDVYRVAQSGQQFILKIYGDGWRTDDEVHYEIALLDHLAHKGLPVVRTITGRDGHILKHIDGLLAVLFNFVPGQKPQPPFSDDLYIRFGKAIANMHNLSDNFVTDYQRRPIDLTYLIDDPLAVILPLLTSADKKSALLEAAADAKRRILELDARGLDWGAIHGDATLDNLHVDEDGQIILYDFDSGGPGWRASDLQGWAVNNVEYQDRYQAYLEGYRSVRQLREPDLQASPFVIFAWEIWGIKVNLNNRMRQPEWDQTAAYLDEQLTELFNHWDAIK
jgi:Ser/Thr protein kinase RdoA (MazF antagonist)